METWHLFSPAIVATGHIFALHVSDLVILMTNVFYFTIKFNKTSCPLENTEGVLYYPDNSRYLRCSVGTVARLMRLIHH